MAAQLLPIDLVAPGFRGLNLAQSSTLLDPSFATIADNCVIDDSGRLAARLGYSLETTSPLGSNSSIKSIHEYISNASAVQTIVAWDGGIANSISDPGGNDVSGTVDDADGRWLFNNFNNKVIGFQSGQKPIVYTGTGVFSPVSDPYNAAPTGGVGLAAFGRVWCVDSDKTTIKYSALLDETTWGGEDSGIIDTRTLWTDGTDEVTALAAFNSTLVIFGKRHIIMYIDGQGSAIGLDPLTMYVVDTITGTGAVSQFTLQPVAETDLLFLSSNGVQSIRRLVGAKSNPIQSLTKLVRDQLIRDIEQEGDEDIRSVYSPSDGFYILSLPSVGRSYVLDQRHNYTDPEGDEISLITTWTLAPTAMASLINNDLLLGTDDGVTKYGGSTTDAGTSMRIKYQSPWLDLGEDAANRLKILKRIGAVVFVQTNTSIVFKWFADFSEDFKTATHLIDNTDEASEWGLGEWDIGEWGGGLTLRIIKLPARATAQYFRLSVEANIDGQFALQQLEMFAKIGRIA
jgi:hypothetical protein